MDGQGRWLPVHDAAKVLGVSDRTVRRYVQEQRYRSRVVGRLTELWLSTDGRVPSRDEQRPTMGGPTATIRPTVDSQATGVPSADGHAVIVLGSLLREEREARSHAEQAAAMWQERARNLEAQVDQLLVLPAHEEVEPRRRWWHRWRTTRRSFAGTDVRANHG